LASIAGAALYYVLRILVEGTLVASIVAMAAVVVLRLLAAKYRWSLPKVHLGENE
jgi:uncharacterized membrane protein YeiH